MTRTEIKALEDDAKIVAAQLKASRDVATPAAAAEVALAAGAMDQGRHPERGTVFGIAAMAKMILTTKGWVSSYGCVTTDSQGRTAPCDGADGGDDSAGAGGAGN